jgi:type II secretory pathway component GspD/PulD (secretin)
VPSGQSITTGGFANYSITRESVGIKLKITPQINESDNIKMDIYTEISSAVSSPQGLDVNTYGVTTSNKVAETSVIVRDSQTIVIGGLMKDNDSQTSNWVPFLGDIPLLGWLFKNASTSKQKTNLIILITPHIVKRDADVTKVNEHVQEGYSNMQKDSRGAQSLDWDKYFETQLPEAPETTPSYPSPPPEEWEWSPQPEEPETGPQGQREPGRRSTSTRSQPGGASP